MPFSLLVTATFVVLVMVGLAWPLAARLALSPGEKLVASCALSLIGTYFWGFAIYVLGWPTELWWLLPATALANLIFARRTLRAAFADTDARAMAVGQALVTAWCVGWLSLVVSYSGGEWIGDWFGHWQRARLFLQHGSPDILFNGFDPLPSRPPLVNVVTAVFLRFGDGRFSDYQLITTLLGSFAFAPAALLAGRLGGLRAITILAVLVMLNPLVVQNATFAWTKLPAAFFVLTALYFFQRARDHDSPLSTTVLCGATLAAAILAHYSAAPYAILMTGIWCVCGWQHRFEPAWRRATGWAALAGVIVLASWFGWALATYGLRGTFLTNTTVTEQAPTLAAQMRVVALNFRDTFVPPFLREVDFGLFAQGSAAGWWRDWFFQLYQVNLLFAFGCVGWVAILPLLYRRWRDASRADRLCWGAFIGGTIVLGIAAHSARDTWGLVHICLQPLVLLGLALLAANWPNLGIGWQRTLVAGSTIDFATGIALHFGVQNGAIDRWLTTKRSDLEIFFSYSQFAQMNLRAKLQNHWIFLGDVTSGHAGVIAFALMTIGVLAMWRATRALDLQGSKRGPLSDKSALRLALAAAAAGAVACLWKAWCEFPQYGWNELRLAPAFEWRHGINPYPPLGGGPLSTWIYGPVGMLVNLPATWAPSVKMAVHVASLINALVVLGPLALIFSSSRELRARGWAVKWFALSLGILLVPAPNLSLQVPDHAAITLGIISCWCLAREASVSNGRMLAAAALCTLAIFAKQLAAFLIPAQLVYLVITHQRTCAARYLLAVVAMNAIALGLCGFAFGFSNFWLNTIAIPGRLPWADHILERLTWHAWALLVQIALPSIVLWVLWKKKRWPPRESESGRFFVCATLAFVAMIPIGLAALLKYGGNTNVLHSWGYLLPAALVIWLAHEREGATATWSLLGVTAMALALRWTDLTSLPVRPITAHYDRAAEITAAFPDGSWFPNNPLITFYADRKFWHTHDGIVTRDLAGIGLRETDFRRHIPPDLRIIVYPVGIVFPVALQLLPEYSHAAIDGQWSIHSRAPLISGTP